VVSFKFVTVQVKGDAPVSSLILSLTLQISLLAAVSDNAAISTPSAPAPNAYAAAYHDTQESGKPLVILVGASWCPACQSMKTSIMPAVQAQGGLSDVSFAYVNTDAQHELAGQLLEGNMIPQLVMYEKAADGSWKLSRLVGAQSVEAVQGFIGPAAKQAIALKQQSASQTPTAHQPASAAKEPTAARRSVQQSTAG
jgi:thioredoxin-like negative regulator of GroEL